MINAFPEAEAPEIGIREHWGTGRGKEEGGYIIFAKRACFWKVSLTWKSPATHLLSTLRTTASLTEPLQGGANVQLLSASSNGLGEPRGLRGGGQHGEQRKQCAWALRGSAEPQLMGMRGDSAVPGTHGHFSAATTEFFCPSCPQAPCLRSNRSPPARRSLGELHRAHLPYSFKARLWPMWSLSAPVTQKGGDWGAPGASALSLNTQQHPMLCRKTACPGLQSPRGALPSGQGQRGPEIPHKDIRFGQEQIIYLPDLRWSLAWFGSQFLSGLSTLLASSVALRLSWACWLLLSSASSSQLHQRNTTTKEKISD